MARLQASVVSLLWLASTVLTSVHIHAGRSGAAQVTLAVSVVALLVAGPAQKETTRMSKPNKKTYRLSQIRESTANKRGSAIEIETEDGQTFELPTPGFWPDEATELMGKGREVELAGILLGGPEEYARFKAAGGRAGDVAMAMEAYGADQGATTGESSASSDS